MKKDLKYYLSLKYPHTVEECEDDGKTYLSLEIPDLPGCGASGETYEEALAQLQEAKELWIEASLKRGLSVPEPLSEDDFSGKFLLRIPARLHMELSKRAKAMDLSLNQYIKSHLEKADLFEQLKIEMKNRDETFIKAFKLLSNEIEKLNEKITSLEQYRYTPTMTTSTGYTMLMNVDSGTEQFTDPNIISGSKIFCSGNFDPQGIWRQP